MHDLYLADVPAELADVTPLGDFVLVRRLPDAESKAGIWIPDSARNPREGNRRGVVISCGPGDRVHPRHVVHNALRQLAHGTTNVPRHPMHVKPGDEIIYARVPANDIRIDGQEYMFLHEEQHILCVIEREASEESFADAA